VTYRLTKQVISVVAALALILVTAMVVTPASAARLTVKSSAIMTVTASRCTTATLQTTAPAAGQSTVLRITGVPASCAGRAISVKIVGTNGTVISTGTLASATTGTNNVTVASYATANVASVGAFFDTWWINNTWTAPQPTLVASCVPMDSAGNVVSGTCAVTEVDASNSWGETGSQTANVYIKVTSSADRFRVTFDFSKSPFAGWTPTAVNKGNLEAAPGASCATLPVFTMNGPTWSSNSYYFQISQVASSGNICPGP